MILEAIRAGVGLGLGFPVYNYGFNLELSFCRRMRQSDTGVRTGTSLNRKYVDLSLSACMDPRKERREVGFGGWHSLPYSKFRVSFKGGGGGGG